MLLLATIKDKAVDHSLLRKLDLLPIRSRRRERMSCDDGWLATDDLDAVEPSDVTYKVGGHSSCPTVTTSSSSSWDGSDSKGKVEDDINDVVHIDEIDTEARSEARRSLE